MRKGVSENTLIFRKIDLTVFTIHGIKGTVF